VKLIWSLIGLLLIVPWAKVLTAIGLIDLPNQIGEWGRLFELLNSTYISIGAAVIGLSIIVAANFEWLRDRFRKRALAPPAEVPERAPAPTEPNMRLAEVLRHVLGKEDIVGSTEKEAQAFFQALRTIEQKGNLGVIDVFGGVGLRTTNPQNWDDLRCERIPPGFWTDNEIDVYHFMNDDRGSTTNRADRPRTTRYHGLWFDRRQIDATWPD
jgi:hypothetical protein